MYTQEKLAMIQLGTGAPDDLSAPGVHSTSYLVGSQLMLNRVMAHVSTLTNGPATVVAKRRPTQGSAVGEVVVATMVIPTATAVGKVVYKDIDPVNFKPGDELVYEVTVAAVAGGAHYMQEVDDDPEQPSEQGDMIESA